MDFWHYATPNDWRFINSYFWPANRKRYNNLKSYEREALAYNFDAFGGCVEDRAKRAKQRPCKLLAARRLMVPHESKTSPKARAHLLTCMRTRMVSGEW